MNEFRYQATCRVFAVDGFCSAAHHSNNKKELREHIRMVLADNLDFGQVGKWKITEADRDGVQIPVMDGVMRNRKMKKRSY